MECKLQPLERSLAGECNHTEYFWNLAGNDDDEGEYDGVDSDNFVVCFIATL